MERTRTCCGLLLTLESEGRRGKANHGEEKEWFKHEAALSV